MYQSRILEDVFLLEDSIIKIMTECCYEFISMFSTLTDALVALWFNIKQIRNQCLQFFNKLFFSTLKARKQLHLIIISLLKQSDMYMIRYKLMGKYIIYDKYRNVQL